EPGATQTFERRKNAECHHHVRTKLHLAWATGFGIGRAEDWRRQMEREAEVALELLIQLCMELAVRIKPRDFVFILIGHQFEQGARRGFGETVLAGRFDRLDRKSVV